MVFHAVRGDGLKRGPVRLADDHLPGIRDHERRAVRSFEDEDRVAEHQVFDDAVAEAQDGHRRGRAEGVGDVAGVPVFVRHPLDGLGEQGGKTVARRERQAAEQGGSEAAGVPGHSVPAHRFGAGDTGAVDQYRRGRYRAGEVLVGVTGTRRRGRHRHPHLLPTPFRWFAGVRIRGSQKICRRHASVHRSGSGPAGSREEPVRRPVDEPAAVQGGTAAGAGRAAPVPVPPVPGCPDRSRQPGRTRSAGRHGSAMSRVTFDRGQPMHVST